MTTTTVAMPSAPGSENQAPAWRENLNVHIVCPDCKRLPPNLIEENADTICADCGRVLAERLISSESEWRTFNNDEKGGEDPNRVGDVESDLFLGSSGTTIGGGGPNISKQTRSLKKAQAMQNEDKQNRALQTAYQVLDGWADQEHLPNSVKTAAKGTYKEVYESNSFRGKNTNAILAGCLFIACRNMDVSRSFAEIMNLTRVAKKEIGRTFKQLQEFTNKQQETRNKDMEEKGYRVTDDALASKNSKAAGPKDHVGRFVGMLGLPFRVNVVASTLADKIAVGVVVAGRSPLSIAGASIYFASHLLGVGRTLADISAVANVSDATIKQAYRKVYSERNSLIEPEWLGTQPQSLKEINKDALIGDIENLPKVA